METNIEYLSHAHAHPLILRDETKNDEDKKCSACEKSISGQPSYGCSECKEFVIHKTCADLPQQHSEHNIVTEYPKEILQHPFHPLHTLSLSPKPISKSSWYAFWASDYCDACGNTCSGSGYSCAPCKFNIHLGCSKLVPTISYKHHPHHLLIHFDKSDTERSCYCCGKQDQTSFSRCVQCDFNVHKSCTELPGEIRHPFHATLHPPLTLADCPNPKRCDFCSRLGIQHPRTSGEPKKAFVCVDCDFIIQISCFDSLPLTIDHECHVCPMTLTDSVVDEQDNVDEQDIVHEYYCDSCETQRNPDSPVYYCTECEFVAHINCVISREVLSLPTLEQKIKKKAEEAHKHLSSTLNDYHFNIAFERQVFQGGGDVANPAIAKLDEDIAKLCVDIEDMLKKLDNLKSQRVALQNQEKK